jgi:surface carbohydrate biosynthesis protein
MSNIFFDYAKVLDVKKIKSNYEKWEIELLHYTLTLLANISKYCEKNEIKLNILGASQNFDLEEKFFKNIFKKNTFNFLKKTSLYNSYKNIDQFSVAINAMSTFGYEAIARKKKVCFFSGDFIEGSNFLWPISNLKKGNFFTNSNNLNEVTRILDYLLNLQEKVWCQEIEEYNKKLFFYDEDNNKFKNFIKKLV